VETTQFQSTGQSTAVPLPKKDTVRELMMDDDTEGTCMDYFTRLKEVIHVNETRESW